MNQSEFQANICGHHQAQENACKQVTIGLVRLTDKVAQDFLANRKAYQCKTKAKP